MKRDTALPYERNLHKRRTQMIFEDLRQEFRLKDDPGIFVRVEQFDYSNGEERNIESVELSVFSKKIYEYDRETILEENNNLSIRNYRPFFVSIIIPIDNCKQQGFFLEMSDRWVSAIINPRNFEEPKDQRSMIFDATLVCSASPFSMTGIKIMITPSYGQIDFEGEDINELIKAEYNADKFKSCIVQPIVIDSELCSAWEKNGYDYIDIYNVGHGNADYIVCGKKRILYDIGYQYRKIPNLTTSLFAKTTRSFARLRPNLVIISHWDSDHFMGCVYASDAVFNVNWIAPTLTSDIDKTFSLNSFRLAAFLKVTHKLMLVDRTAMAGGIVGFSKPSQNCIVLSMGESSSTETGNITRRNKEGLYVKIYKVDKLDTVLSGDVPYNSMDRLLFSAKELNFMHVPHHCSKMKLDKLLGNKWANKNKHAIISTDKNKAGTDYNENADHRRELGTIFGKNVHYTIGDLSQSIDGMRAIRLYRDGSVKERI